MDSASASSFLSLTRPFFQGLPEQGGGEAQPQPGEHRSREPQQEGLAQQITSMYLKPRPPVVQSPLDLSVKTVRQSADSSTERGQQLGHAPSPSVGHGRSSVPQAQAHSSTSTQRVVGLSAAHVHAHSSDSAAPTAHGHAHSSGNVGPTVHSHAHSSGNVGPPAHAPPPRTPLAHVHSSGVQQQQQQHGNAAAPPHRSSPAHTTSRATPPVNQNSHAQQQQQQQQPGSQTQAPPPHQHYFPVNFYNYNSSYYSGYPAGYHGNYPPWYYGGPGAGAPPVVPPQHMMPPQPQHMGAGQQPVHNLGASQVQGQGPNLGTPINPMQGTATTHMPSPVNQMQGAVPHPNHVQTTPHFNPSPSHVPGSAPHFSSPANHVQASPSHLPTNRVQPQTQNHMPVTPPTHANHLQSSSNPQATPTVPIQQHPVRSAQFLSPSPNQNQNVPYKPGGLTSLSQMPFNMSSMGQPSMQRTSLFNPFSLTTMQGRGQGQSQGPGAQANQSQMQGLHQQTSNQHQQQQHGYQMGVGIPPPHSVNQNQTRPFNSPSLNLNSSANQGQQAYPPLGVGVVPPPAPSNPTLPFNQQATPTLPQKSSPKKPSRKSLLNLLRNSLESRMLKNDDKKNEKFQFNHQTWNFHRKSGELTSPRIKTKAEKKQLFPNLLGQSVPAPPPPPSAQSESVFDFREDEDKGSVSVPLALSHPPLSLPKKKSGSKKFTTPRFAPGLPPIPMVLPAEELCEKIIVEEPKPKPPPPAILLDDPIFNVFDSFLEDLNSANPNQIKSKRGFKKKPGDLKGASVVRRKNESEEDEDFEVEEEEVKAEESEETNKSESEASSKTSEETKSEGSSAGVRRGHSGRRSRRRQRQVVVSSPRRLRISSSSSSEDSSETSSESSDSSEEEFTRKLRPKRGSRRGPHRGSSSTSNSGSSGEEWRGARGVSGPPLRKRRRIRFGDGSEFKRPGLEEELMDFKRKLRMPSQLISVRSGQKRESRDGRSSTRRGRRREESPSVNEKRRGSRREEKSKSPVNEKRRGRRDVESPSPIEKKKSATEKPTPEKKSVEKPTPEKKSSEKPTPEKKSSDKPTPEKKSIEKPTPDKKSVEKATPDKKSVEKAAPDKKLKKPEEPSPLLPTPGISKFNARMSIKSVFGVELPRKILRRNKFKSGFDYIRKKPTKKKQQEALDTATSVKQSKQIPIIPKNQTPTDIQSEIRSWVLNKGLGETTLHRAARLGYKDVASYSLENNICGPNVKDNAGYSPLHECCVKGNLEVAKVLLEYGANVSQAAPGGMRPLHEAIENGHIELCRLLISYGADPLLATYSGQTPLELAEPHPGIKKLLLQHMADVQGKETTPWDFTNWAEDSFDSGFDVMSGCPSPVKDDTLGFEFEASEGPLPPLYRLKDTTTPYVLLQDVLNYLSTTKDRFLKQNPVETIELNSNDFLEEAHCCHLLGEKFNLNNSSEFLTLIKYDERIKKMMNIEQCFIK